MGYMDDQDGKDYTETEQKKIQKKHSQLLLKL